MTRLARIVLLLGLGVFQLPASSFQLPAGTAGAGFPAGSPSPGAGGARRDVVLVTIDTLRYDATGFDGNRKGTTPNLDRFAREGRVFSFAHGQNVLTLPSHTNILTGLYPYQHGVRDNSGFRLSPKVETAATILKAKGFATGAFVAAFVLDSRYRARAGLRRVRRDLPARGRPRVLRHRAEPRRRDRLGGARLVREAGTGTALPLDPPVRSPRAVRPAGRLPEEARRRSVLGRGGVRGRRARAAPPGDPRAPPRAAPRRHGRPRRGPRRPRRADARALRVRADAPRPALSLVPRARLSRNRRAPRSPRRPPADHPRGGEGARAAVAARGLSAGSSAGRGDVLLRVARREFQPRLGSAARDPGRRAQVRGPPDPRALRSPGRSEGDPEPAARLLRRAGRRPKLLKTLLETPAGPVDPLAVASDEAAKLRSLGYLSGGGEKKDSYGPADDPKNRSRSTGSSTSS